jgi:hypothetical protein
MKWNLFIHMNGSVDLEIWKTSMQRGMWIILLLITENQSHWTHDMKQQQKYEHKCKECVWKCFGEKGCQLSIDNWYQETSSLRIRIESHSKSSSSSSSLSSSKKIQSDREKPLFLFECFGVQILFFSLLHQTFLDYSSWLFIQNKRNLD